MSDIDSILRIANDYVTAVQSRIDPIVAEERLKIQAAHPEFTGEQLAEFMPDLVFVSGEPELTDEEPKKKTGKKK